MRENKMAPTVFETWLTIMQASSTTRKGKFSHDFAEFDQNSLNLSINFIIDLFHGLRFFEKKRSVIL